MRLTTVASGVDPGFDKVAASTIKIAGDFINNSASTSLAAHTTTIEFDGTSAQNLAGSASTTFSSLKINNAAGLSLSSGVNATVNGTLTLSAGNVMFARHSCQIPTSKTGKLLVTPVRY